MKSSSKVWSASFLAMVLAAAVIPAAAQNQPGSSTPEQLAKQAEIMSKLVAAESVVAKEEATVGRAYDKAYRSTIIKGLTSKPLNDIWAIPDGFVASTGLDGAAIGIGDTADNLVYTPVAPCRIIDTRLVGGAIPSGGTRSFDAAGGSFSGQGGLAGSCGVPFGPATAVVINFVAVSPSGGGDLRVWPFGGAVPTASIINYVIGNNVANGVPVAICNPAVSACGFDITVQSDSASVQIVADVQGYFSKPSTPVTQNLSAVVNADATLARGFRATADISLSTGTYQVDFDRDITNCAYVADIGLSTTSGASAPGFVTVVGRAGDPNGLFIQTYNTAGALTNLGYHVLVTCPAAPSTP